MGMDETHTWAPFELCEEDYKHLLNHTSLKVTECPNSVSDVFSWQAWVLHVEKGIPFEEHLVHLIKERDALLFLNRALASGNKKAIADAHLKYIEAADEAMEFIRGYF